MEPSLLHFNTGTAILFTIPVCWGVYELRKLTKLLESYKTTVDALTPKVISTTTIIENITKEELEEYPFIMKLKLLVDKSNRILH
jgi:hypothetical protein